MGKGIDILPRQEGKRGDISVLQTAHMWSDFVFQLSLQKLNIQLNISVANI